MQLRNILCIGAGFVGGPTMAVMADKCPDIRFTVVDINAERIAQWNSPQLPVFEPGLDEIIERVRDRNLFFREVEPRFIADADMIFVSVNTPTKEFGEGAGMAADLQYVEKCARQIMSHATGTTIVVEKSTIPVRTAEVISHILKSNNDDRIFHVLSNPEFLAESVAVRDLEQPDRVLIGHEHDEGGNFAAEQLCSIYRRWVPEEKILLSNVWSSELTKLVSNVMLAQRVSSINAVSALCEQTGADVGEIGRAIGMDSRIGAKFLQAGVGFGGSCFRKDILNLAYISGQHGLDEVAAYWKSVVEMNDYQIGRFAKLIVKSLFNTVAGKKIAIFGFAFKPGTNDTRDSPAMRICLNLLEEQAQLAITDPKALDNARKDLQGIANGLEFMDDPYLAAEGAHAIVLLTHWPEFASLDYKRIFAAMQQPAFFFDGRRQLDPEMLFDLGFNVYAIGTPPLTRF